MSLSAGQMPEVSMVKRSNDNEDLGSLVAELVRGAWWIPADTRVLVL